MSKLKVTFPNGTVVYATMREKEEPEFCQRASDRLKDGPLKCPCYHTLSTGGLFDSFPRPPKHPVATGNQVDVIGNESKLICDLDVGDISSAGWNFAFTWDFCSEAVPIGGPVIAKVDPEYLKDYVVACRDVWYHDYLYHKVAVLTIEKVEG